ncbi:MAG: hypothetical protein Aurels2KO_16530 [Aureliella sp.]
MWFYTLREQGTPVKIRDGPAAVSHRLVETQASGSPFYRSVIVLASKNEKTRVSGDGDESEDLPMGNECRFSGFGMSISMRFFF